MNSFFHKAGLLVGLVAGYHGSAQAALLTQYSFNNSFASSNTLAGISATAITPVGVPAVAFRDDVGTPNWFNEGSHGLFIPHSNLLAPGISQPGNPTYYDYTATSGILPQGSQYLEMTLTPQSGNSIDFAGITVDARRTNVDAGVTRVHFALYYDDLADGDGFQHLGTNIRVSNVNPWINDFTMNFDALAALDNIGTAGVTFRIYAFEGSSTTFGADNSTLTTDGLQLDDLRFNGTVNAVPEPGSLAVLALGGALLGLAIRRGRTQPARF